MPSLKLSRLAVVSPVATLSLGIGLLTGCGYSAMQAGPSPVDSAAIGGTVFGGQQPVTGSVVTVWQVGATGYGSAATSLATTTSQSGGSFQFAASAYTCTPGAQVYITAAGGDAGTGSNNAAILLAAGLGSCTTAKTATVNIDEVTTVATAYALGSFFDSSFASDSFGAPADQVAGPLAIANASTIPMLVNLARGAVNPNTATLQIEAAKLYTIANIVASCVNSASSSTNCAELFADTQLANNGPTPVDTLQAAVAIAFYPYQNVGPLFQLASATPPFPGLSVAPNDWTLGVSYTSPKFGLGIASSGTAGTSSNIDIDSSGNVWFPSTLPGATGVGSFNPATGAFGGPYIGGLSQPQYVAIDQGGILWVTDVSSGNIGSLDTANPTNNTVTNIGTLFNNSAATLQAVGVGDDNTVYFDINDNGTFLASIDPTRSTLNEPGEFDFPATGLAPIDFGSGNDTYVLDSGSGTNTVCEVGATDVTAQTYGSFTQSASPCQSGGAAIATGAYDALAVASTLNQVCSALDGCFAPPVAVSLPQGIATDGGGYEWIANAGNGSVSVMAGADTTGGGNDYEQVSPVPYLHGNGNGATMTQPYGIAVDGAGNVWTSNASCTTAGCTPGSFTLSELIGAAAPTVMPLSLQDGGLNAGFTPATRRAAGAAVRSPLGARRLQAIPAQGTAQRGISLGPLM